MSQQNPYSAPQTNGQPTGGIIAPYVPVQQLIPWLEPLRTQILNVATHQRWLNVHLLVAIVGGILYGVFGQKANARPGASELNPLGLLLAAMLVMNYACLIYRIYNLVKSLNTGDSPLLATLGMFIPLIGLILLLFFSSKATKFLRQFGIAVGLLGASPSAIAQQLNQAEQAANPAAYPSTVPQNSVPQFQLPPPSAALPGALPMAQAIPAAPARPAPPAAAPAKPPQQLPMGKPVVQAPTAKPAAPPAARPAAAGQLPVARPLPPVQSNGSQAKPAQPKPPQPPKA